MIYSKEALEGGIGYYQAELANIRYFLREERGIIEWQDWLRRRMPKLLKQTMRIPPSAMPLGQGWADLACRYTDILTICCMLGKVERTRTETDTRYKWVGE